MWTLCEEQLPPKMTKVLCGIYGTDFLYPHEGETVEECARRNIRTSKRIEVGYLDEDGYWNCEEGFPMNPIPTVWCPFPYLPSWEELHCEKGDDFDCNTCEKQEVCFSADD